MLRRISIDSITFNKLLEMYPKYLEKCDSLNKYQLKGYSDKKTIRYTDTEMVIQGYRVNQLYGKTLLPSWMQVVCVKNEALEEHQIKRVMWASQACKLVNEALHKYYTEEELSELYQKHSRGIKAGYLSTLLPYSWLDGKIHKFTGCRYYDINKAHTDALCEIFPKASKELIALTEKDKLIINMFVGQMCNTGHRDTYNWIAQRTYDKIQGYIKECGGIILYAKTDGFITWCPTKELMTSNEVGGVKQQSVDGIVYAYRCDDKKTPYTLYEYNDTKEGIVRKGTARLNIRKDIDLSKGLVMKGDSIEPVEIVTEEEYYEVF